MAACYGVINPPDKVEHLDQDDPFEAAFETSFTAAPAKKGTAPIDDDPLGLEEAFDAAFPLDTDTHDLAETSESDCPEESHSEGDESDDSRHGIAPSDTGSGCITDADDGDDADLSARRALRRVKAMRASALFKREGKNVIWDRKTIGTISGFSGAVSCSCRLHTKCRSPASKALGV